MTGRTFGEDLARGAALHPDRIAVVTDDGDLSYGQLDELASGIAAGLLSKGVERGDRVAVMLPNGLAMAASIYGVLRAGAAFVPLNPTIKREKLAGLLGRSEAGILICDEQRAQVAGEAVAEVPGAEVVDDIHSLRAEGRVRAKPLSSDLAAIVYTSGSTGVPKGVTLTHRNMTFVADSMIEYLEMDDRERVMCVLPLSFGYGLYQLLTCVRAGATLVLQAGLAFPGRVVQLLDEQAVTALPGVPTVFNVLLSLHGLEGREFPQLRVLTNAGAALPAATIAQLRQVFPSARLYSMYGQTECQRVCYLPPSELDARPTSVGVAIPGTQRVGGGCRRERRRCGGRRRAHGSGGPRDAGLLERSRMPRRSACGQAGGPGSASWRRETSSAPTKRAFCISSGGATTSSSPGARRCHRAKSRRCSTTLPASGRPPLSGCPTRSSARRFRRTSLSIAGHDQDPSAIRRYCAQRLEDYMVPRSVIFHAKLPRTENGKLDRQALIGHRFVGLGR